MLAHVLLGERVQQVCQEGGGGRGRIAALGSRRAPLGVGGVPPGAAHGGLGHVLRGPVQHLWRAWGQCYLSSAFVLAHCMQNDDHSKIPSQSRNGNRDAALVRTPVAIPVLCVFAVPLSMKEGGSPRKAV